MASVSSLDQDMRKLRLSRYTPAAANEARAWIETTLHEKLAPGDLLEALKDGVALCTLANMALPPPGIKFKKSSMPFVQMENISHFLRACESPPLNMPAHDRFLTVDLYEGKDPAQVLQCLSAFSRVANQVAPRAFPTSIGPKRGGALSPTPTGEATNGGSGRWSPVKGGGGTSASQAMPGAARALSPTLTGGSNRSGTSATSPPPVSTWSKKEHEGTTAPAWNIAQYGYMGGASQGNQGISFGARRQITSAAPHVPSLAEKEKKRKEQEAEAERVRIQAEEAEERRRAERAAEEDRARAEEERLWEEQTRKARDEERLAVERQKRQWEEEERQWKQDEEARREEERAETARFEQDKISVQRKRGDSNARPDILRGQSLAEYQREARSRQASSNYPSSPAQNTESDRVRDLERQLEEAKAREAEYERERQERARTEEGHSTQDHPASSSRVEPAARDVPQRIDSTRESEASWTGDERLYLRQQHRDFSGGARPLPEPGSTSTRPLPDPGSSSTIPAVSSGPRPLPNPDAYAPGTTRTSRFLASNPAPSTPSAAVNTAPDSAISTSGEQAEETTRRLLSQQKTKAGGWASKSLLEREMERERERQREWEEAQKEAKERPRNESEAFGPAGETWDAHQYGYMGGDSQNRGGQGIGFGGRRQIIGPRPQGPR